jgi:hypothetical protein
VDETTESPTVGDDVTSDPGDSGNDSNGSDNGDDGSANSGDDGNSDGPTGPNKGDAGGSSSGSVQVDAVSTDIESGESQEGDPLSAGVAATQTLGDTGDGGNDDPPDVKADATDAAVEVPTPVGLELGPLVGPSASGPAPFQAPDLVLPSAPTLKKGKIRRLKRKSGLDLDPAGHHAQIQGEMTSLIDQARRSFSDIVAEGESQATVTADIVAAGMEHTAAVAEGGVTQVKGTFETAHTDVDNDVEAAKNQVSTEASAQKTAAKASAQKGYGSIGWTKKNRAAKITKVRLSETENLRTLGTTTNVGIKAAETSATKDITAAEVTLGGCYGEPSGPILGSKTTSTTAKSEADTYDPIKQEKVVPLLAEVGDDYRKNVIPDDMTAFSENLAEERDGAKGSVERATEVEALDGGATTASKSVGRTAWLAKRDIGREETEAHASLETMRSESHASLNARSALFVDALERSAVVLRDLAADERTALMQAAWSATAGQAEALLAVVHSGHEQVILSAVEELIRADTVKPMLEQIAAGLQAAKTSQTTEIQAAAKRAQSSANARLSELDTQLAGILSAGDADAAPFIESLRNRLAELQILTATTLQAPVPLMEGPIDAAKSGYRHRADDVVDMATEKAGTAVSDMKLDHDAQVATATKSMHAYTTGFNSAAQDAEKAALEATIKDLAARATKADKAMNGAGTDEAMLYDAFDGVSKTEGWSMEAYFAVKEGWTLNRWMKGDLDAGEYTSAYTFLTGDSVAGRMSAMKASQYWYGSTDGVVEQSMRKFRSQDELDQLIGMPGFDTFREQMLGDLSGVELKAFLDMESNNLAGMHAEYLKKDLDAARKNNKLDEVADAFIAVPPDLHCDIIKELAGKVRRDEEELRGGVVADEDTSAEDVVKEFINGERTYKTGYGEDERTQTIKGFEGDDSSVVDAYVDDGANSVGTDAAWTNREVNKQKKEGEEYKSDDAQKYIGGGRTDMTPEDYDAALKKELTDEHGMDIDAELTSLNKKGSGFDAQALAGKVSDNKVPLNVAVELLLKKDSNQGELDALLANATPEELEELWTAHSGLKDRIMKDRKGREKQEMEWALRGAPQTDLAFWELVRDKYTYSRKNKNNGAGGMAQGSDLDAAYTKLEESFSGRSPAASFDGAGTFIGTQKEWYLFRMGVELSGIAYTQYMEAKDADASLLSTIAGVVLAIALAPFTAGASMMILAALAGAAVTVGTKYLMLGDTYTGGEMWEDAIDAAGEDLAINLLTAGTGKLAAIAAKQDTKIFQGIARVLNTGGGKKALEAVGDVASETKSIGKASWKFIESEARDYGNNLFAKAFVDLAKDGDWDGDATKYAVTGLMDVPGNLAKDLLGKAAKKKMGGIFESYKSSLPGGYDPKKLAKINIFEKNITSAVVKTSGSMGKVTTKFAMGSYGEEGQYGDAMFAALQSGVVDYLGNSLYQQNIAKNDALAISTSAETDGQLPKSDLDYLDGLDSKYRDRVFMEMDPAKGAKIKTAYVTYKNNEANKHNDLVTAATDAIAEREPKPKVNYDNYGSE